MVCPPQSKNLPLHINTAPCKLNHVAPGNDITQYLVKIKYLPLYDIKFPCFPPYAPFLVLVHTWRVLSLSEVNAGSFNEQNLRVLLLIHLSPHKTGHVGSCAVARPSETEADPL